MFCSQCGNTMAEGSAFCTSCGTRMIPKGNEGPGSEPVVTAVTSQTEVKGTVVNQEDTFEQREVVTGSYSPSGTTAQKSVADVTSTAKEAPPVAPAPKVVPPTPAPVAQPAAKVTPTAPVTKPAPPVAPAPTPVAPAPVPPRQTPQAASTVAPQQVAVDVRLEPMSIWAWLGTFLLMLIPIVSLILPFVWAFSSGTNKSKKTFFQAYLLMTLVFIVLGIVFGSALAIFFGSLSEEFL